MAAPQVGELIQLAIVDTEYTDESDYDPFVLINPSIVEESDTLRPFSEGCLSIPGINCEISRPDHVVVEAYDLDGTSCAMRPPAIFSASACSTRSTICTARRCSSACSPQIAVARCHAASTRTRSPARATPGERSRGRSPVKEPLCVSFSWERPRSRSPRFGSSPPRHDVALVPHAPRRGPEPRQEA